MSFSAWNILIDNFALSPGNVSMYIIVLNLSAEIQNQPFDLKLLFNFRSTLQPQEDQAYHDSIQGKCNEKTDTSMLILKVTISLPCMRSETHNLQHVSHRIQDTKWGSLCQAFLAETVETGTNNCCMIETTHVLRRKLMKD